MVVASIKKSGPYKAVSTVSEHSNCSVNVSYCNTHFYLSLHIFYGHLFLIGNTGFK